MSQNVIEWQENMWYNYNGVLKKDEIFSSFYHKMVVVMANENNLITSAELSPEERKSMASLGGIAAAKSKKEKKNLKEAARMILNMPISPAQEEMQEIMQQVGIENEDRTYAMSIILAMTIKAMKGDVKAANFLKDVSGLDMMDKLNNQDATEKEDVVIYLPDNGRDDVPDKTNSADTGE